MAIFDIDDDIEYIPNEDEFDFWRDILQEIERLECSAGLNVYCCYCHGKIKFDAYVDGRHSEPVSSDKIEGSVCGGWQMKCPHCGKTIVLTICKHYKDA